MRAAQQFAVDDDRAADADLPRQVQEGAHLAEGAEPQLGEGRRVGLVVGGDGQAGGGGPQGGEGLGEEAFGGDLVPAEVGGLPDGPAGDESGQGEPGPRRHEAEARRLVQGPGGDARGPGQDLAGAGRAVVQALGVPDAVGAGQVGDAGGDVVDVDLDAETGGPGVGRFQNGARPSRLPAEGLARLHEEPEVEELLDEGGDGGPGESDAGRDGGPGGLAGLVDGPQDEAQVVPAHSRLVGLGFRGLVHGEREPSRPFRPHGNGVRRGAAPRVRRRAHPPPTPYRRPSPNSSLTELSSTRLRP